MAYVLGAASRAKLNTVDPRLQKVVLRAIAISKQDFAVTCGARTLEEQYVLYAKGRRPDELRAAGVPGHVHAQPTEKKVTWTLRSNHFPDPKTGLGRAVDVAAWSGGPVWTPKLYDLIRDAMFAAAKELSVAIRWGGDWDMDGRTERGESDLAHFELASSEK